MKKIFLISVFYGLICFFGFGFTDHISALEKTMNTVSVEPASINFEIAEGEDKKLVTLTITNHYDYPVSLLAEFKGIDENTGSIIPTGEINSSLQKNLNLSETNFTVLAKSKYFLTVQVNDSSTLPPGGEYGTLVLRQQNVTSNKSNIESELSLGIFVVKKQGLISKLELSRFSVTRDKFELPSSVRVDLINDGNSHVVPRGYLRLFSSDQVYLETVFNQPSKIVMPSRHYTEEFQVVTNPGLIPKKVHLEMGYRADGIDEIKTYSETFWYVPKFYFPIATFAVILTACLVIFRQKIIKVLAQLKSKSKHS